MLCLYIGNDLPSTCKAVRLGTEKDEACLLRGLRRRLKITCLWTWSVRNLAEHCGSDRSSTTRKVHFESLDSFWNLLSIATNLTNVVFKLIVISLITMSDKMSHPLMYPFRQIHFIFCVLGYKFMAPNA